MEVRLTDKAKNQLATYMGEGDTEGLKELIGELETLATDPRRGVRWGPFHRRLRVGRYRALYAWQEGQIIILVIHVSRTDDQQ